MSYLCEKYGKIDSLYPKNLAKRALVDQRLYFKSGVVFSLLLRIMKFLRAGKPIDPELVELTHSTYNFLNTFLENNEWVAGDHVTIADFSLLSSITSIHIGMVPIDAKYGNILKWIKNAEKLPYYQEANGTGLDQVEGFIASFQNK